MPNYEYKCQKCGNTDEHFMSISERLKNSPLHCCKCRGPMRPVYLSNTTRVMTHSERMGDGEDL